MPEVFLVVLVLLREGGDVDMVWLILVIPTGGRVRG